MIGFVFVAPALVHAGWWALQERPGRWSSADWSSAGILPSAADSREAAIYLLAARVGGLKGAFAVHSWIVVKHPDGGYDRYDKVGWGSPVRKNSYAPDGRWYSNEPSISHVVRGAEAERLIPAVEAAVASYPYSRPGDYQLWPGPNSNSFVAHVLKSVPALGARMPPTAVGRDYSPGWASIEWWPEAGELHGTVGGVLGFAAGLGAGIELQFLGLVAGLDFRQPALIVPTYGRVELWPSAAASGG